MKKLLFTLLLLCLLMGSKAFAQFEKTVGVGAHVKYGVEIESMGAGIHLHYYHTNNLRFAPAFTYYVPQKGNTVWEAEADAHYIVPVSVSASLYPIIGLNYSNRNFDASKAGFPEEKDWTKRRLGANIGVGAQHDIRYRLRANFELKYQYVKDFSQISFMAGVGFWF